MYSSVSVYLAVYTEGGEKEKWVGKYIEHLRIREALLMLSVLVCDAG